MQITKIISNACKAGKNAKSAITHVLGEDGKLIQARIFKENGKACLIDFNKNGTREVRKFNNGKLIEKYDILFGRFKDGSTARTRTDYNLDYKLFADNKINRNPFLVVSSKKVIKNPQGVKVEEAFMRNSGKPLYSDLFGKQSATPPRTDYNNLHYDSKGIYKGETNQQFRNGVWENHYSNINGGQKINNASYYNPLTDREVTELKPLSWVA